MRLRLLAVVAMLSFATAAPAAAHAVLVGADPADGATVTTAPTAVTLTFDDTITQPALTVANADGRVDLANPTISGHQLSVGVHITTASAYTVTYRVVSDDGHPVTGTLHFSYAPPGQPAPAPATQAKPASKLPIYLGAGAVTLVVLVGAGLGLRRRR